ncbi:MAG: hypothetical protein WD850_03185 [Candidatus Spechtbacterales bacterium]
MSEQWGILVTAGTFSFRIQMRVVGATLSGSHWEVGLIGSDGRKFSTCHIAGHLDPEEVVENVGRIMRRYEQIPPEWLDVEFPKETGPTIVELVANVQGFELLSLGQSDTWVEEFFFSATKGLQVPIQAAVYQLLKRQRPEVAVRIQDAFERLREVPDWMQPVIT